jgi:uncharacterized protein YukJ
MPLKNYGVLIGKVVDHYPQPGGNPHYIIEVAAAGTTYRVAMNLESTQRGAPQALQYKIDSAFGTEGGIAANLLTTLRNLATDNPDGTFRLKAIDSSAPVVDYVRGGLTDPASFGTLPVDSNPEDNDFADTFKQTVDAVKNTAGTWIAVFGTGYPDQDDRAGSGNPLNSSFGFEGVDNVHMNQGNYLRIGRIEDSHYYENGPNQDGAVVFFTATTATAYFTKFQSQDALTDEDGNPLHTGVAELDAHVQEAMRASKPLPSQERFMGDANLIPLPEGSKVSKNAPRFGTEADGFVFADPDPEAVPARQFLTDDDGDTYKSDYVVQFSRANDPVPEPVPAPNEGKYPVLDLAQILRPSVIQQIKTANQITFHSVGDTGAPKEASVPHETKVAEMMVQDLPKVTAQGRPSFLFHLGDVVYYYGEEQYYYDQFYKPFEKYAAPIFAIPGNHDGLTYNDSMTSLAAFKNAFCAESPAVWEGSGGIQRSSMIQPGVYFTLDSPFVSIVGLYSNCSETSGYLDQQQLLFLRNELGRLKKRRQDGEFLAFVLAVHHPPYSLTDDTGHSNAMSQAMDAEFETAGLWPDAVLSGHAHVYQRMTRTVSGNRQIPYIVAGNGGYTLSPQQEIDKKGMLQLNQTDPSFRLHQFIDAFGYLLVTISAPVGSRRTGTLAIDFRATNGKGQHDSCTVNLSTNELI